jgi:MGT family glycosyltransferase
VCHDDDVARFLFVVVPIVARVWPAVAIGDALAAAGHEVAWCGPESDLRPLVGPDPVIFPTGKRGYREFREAGMAAVRELWHEYLVPLNRFMRRPVDQAVAEYRPDVVVTDQYALAGTLAAAKHGVPWAHLCAGVIDLTPPAEYLEVREWVHSGLAKVLEAAGLPPDDNLDLLFSPYLMLVTSSRALIGEVPLPQSCVLIGAALGSRRTDPTFDWDRWDPGRQHVLVTAGTLSAHLVRDYLARVIAALDPLGSRVQAVLNVAPDLVPDPPSHVLIAPRVPMLELMPRLDAVICQAGQSTVNEALVNGIPLVVAPIRLGELVVAEQVTKAGAGIEVSFADATPDELRAAITAVLDEPTYLLRARQIREEFRAAGGTQAAVANLISLAGSRQL